MISKKELSDMQIIKKTMERYIYSNDSEYFSRSAKIASYFYDRLLLAIHKNINILLSTQNRNQFVRSIKYFHTDKKIFLFSSKIDFSLRKYVIVNPYNTLYFEYEITKLMNLMIKILRKPILKNYLLENNVFGFAHQINKHKNNTSYYKGWSKYEHQKTILLNGKKYYCEFDISSFYDNIKHSKLILTLESFFKRYLTNKEYVNNNVQDLLKNLNDALYKAKGYSNVGLNQGLLGSDFLSSLYLWLILLLDKDKSKFIFKNGEGYTINDINIMNYSDDFMLFADSEIDIDKNFYYLVNLLEQHGLHIKSSKTNTNQTSLYEQVILLDINGIKTGRKVELNTFHKLLLGAFKKDKFKSLKNYFKRFHLFPEQYLKKTTPFIKYIFELIQKKDIKSATKVLRLCVLSESNFMYLVYILCKLYGPKFEINIVKLFEQYSYLMSEDTFIMLFRFSKKYNLIKLNTLYEQQLEHYNNPIINDILLNKTFHYSLNYYQNNGLLNTLNGENDYKENILGVKMSNIYGIVPTVTKLFSEKLRTNGILTEDYIFKLSQILDNLSYIKSIFISHYNENASFLADTLSLLNILFTIHYSLKKGKPFEVKITNSIGYFKYGDAKNNSLIKYISFTEEEKHFMYFIVKFRAAKNHKEIDILESAEENIINRFANNKELFHITMNNIVEKIFNEIDLYI